MLLVPAVAMQFTREVAWSGGDFVVAWALLSLTGVAMMFASRATIPRPHRAALIVTLGLALLLVWAKLAVGLFG